MAKNVFRPMEIVKLSDQVVIPPPYEEEPEELDVQSIEEYTGPTADDLRREAEAFKQSWEKEKAEMIAAAEAEAETIVAEAEQTAFDQVKARTDEADRIKSEAEIKARELVEAARVDAEKLVAEAQTQRDQLVSEARGEGYEAGRAEGYGSGEAEVQRLIRQLHSVIDKALEKRNEIIAESETQVINLVLLIATKVVKVISENQKNVVINNVIQGLRKLKSRGEVMIKVNLEDVQLTSDHVDDFMRMVENVKSVTVVEDSTVDPGGCLIETDFGQIDARISSQLKEIETKIQEMMPIKVRGDQ